LLTALLAGIGIPELGRDRQVRGDEKSEGQGNSEEH
jgi:hypothetical protein